jgi:predicted Zn-dependent protease
MVLPARSLSRPAVPRLLLSAAVAAGLLAAPYRAAAQDGESLIRDTEIEEILHRDADPILRAASIDPKNVQMIIIGSKDLQAFAAPQGDGRLHRPDPRDRRTPTSSRA